MIRMRIGKLHVDKSQVPYDWCYMQSCCFLEITFLTERFTKKEWKKSNVCYWSHKTAKINSICIWRSIDICVDSGSTCKKAAMLHHLYIGSDKNLLCVRFCSFTFTWKQGHEHEMPLNSTQSAFNLALGHAGRSRRTWWTWFERTFATTSSLQEQQERRQIVWDCFSRVRQNCPLAHTSGLDACRRHAESQSADGGRERERERAKTAESGIYMRQRCKPSWKRCTSTNRTPGIRGIFINFRAAALLFVLICGLIFPWWAIGTHSKLLLRN